MINTKDLNDNNLGKPGKIYNFKMRDNFFIGLISLLCGLISLSAYKEERSIIFIIAAIICVLYSCRFFTRWYSYRDSQIQIYELGLIYTDNKSKETKIYWKDIEEIKQKNIVNYISTITNSHEFNLTTKDGLSLYLPRYVEDVVELGNSIVDYTFEHRLSNYKKMFEDVGKVRFGELVIDKMGITTKNGNKSLAWNDVYNIETKYGKIIIYKRDKLLPWKSIPISKLSNYSILISFLKEKLGTKFSIISKWNEFTFFQFPPNIENPFKAPPIVKKNDGSI